MTGNVDQVDEDPCLSCGSPDDLTVEHIVPQALWRRFGIDPDRSDLAVFRTTLCGLHNRATAVLHERTEMMNLIELGSRSIAGRCSSWATGPCGSRSC